MRMKAVVPSPAEPLSRGRRHDCRGQVTYNGGSVTERFGMRSW